MNTKPEREEGEDSCESSEEEMEPPASNKKVLAEIEEADVSPSRKGANKKNKDDADNKN